MNSVIRRASQNDTPEIVELMKAHANYECADFEPKGLALRLNQAMQGNVPRLIIFVAQINHDLVGYCSVTKEFSSWAANEYLYMDCLFIRSEVRGLRLGKRLFDHAVSFAKTCQIDRLQWQTPDWNHRAIGFYQSIGANHSAKQRFQYDIVG